MRRISIILSVLLYAILIHISELEDAWDIHLLLRDLTLFSVGVLVIYFSKEQIKPIGIYIGLIVYVMIASVMTYNLFGKGMLYGEERSISLVALMMLLSVINTVYYRSKRVKESS
jgi:hypothetical protein